MKNTLFKINIEDYLHSIDSAFSVKTQKDIYMIYGMIVAGIFAFSYLLFWDASVEDFERTRAEVVSLDQKINADKSYLQTHQEFLIVKLDNQIAKINADIVLVKDNNVYIKSQIETIPSLIYDERTWGEYLYSVSQNAHKYHVKIDNFTNEYSAKNQSFGHILNISITSSANYKNTLRFINSLEKSDLVVDIHTMSIKAQEKLNSDLSISVWGITY